MEAQGVDPLFVCLCSAIVQTNSIWLSYRSLQARNFFLKFGVGSVSLHSFSTKGRSISLAARTSSPGRIAAVFAAPAQKADGFNALTMFSLAASEITRSGCYSAGACTTALNENGYQHDKQNATGDANDHCAIHVSTLLSQFVSIYQSPIEIARTSESAQDQALQETKTER